MFSWMSARAVHIYITKLQFTQHPYLSKSCDKVTVDSKTSSPFILFLFGEDGESVEDKELDAGSARFAMPRRKVCPRL